MAVTTGPLLGVFDTEQARLIGITQNGGTPDITYFAGQDTPTPAGALPVTAETNPVTGMVEFSSVLTVLDIRQFGGLSQSNDNSSTFSTMVSQAPTGALITLPAGTWPGDMIINRDFLRIVGAGKPRYSGGVLVGGSVIEGKIESYAKGISMSDLGVDQSALSSSYHDAIVSGMGDEGAYNDNRFERIALLGRGVSNDSLHGIITQGGGRVIYDDISVYRFGHGQVIRCREGHISRGYVEDADLSSYIFKSADTFPANNCRGSSLTNCTATAVAAGKRANLIIQGDTPGYLTRNISANGFWSNGSAEKAVQTIGTAGTVRDIVLQNMHVSGCMASRAFAFEGGFNITGIGLNVYDGPQYSFGGDGALGVRLIGCVSREPISGHKIGNFASTEINGKIQLEASIQSDDPAIVIPAGVLVDTAINGGFEFDGSFLYFTVGGVRKKVPLTAV